MSRRLSEPAVACGLTRVLFTLALLSSTTLHLVAAQSPDLNASTNTTALAAPAPPPPVVVTEDDQALLAQQNSLLNISYPTDGPNVPYFNKTKITVCTSDWMPAIYCANITDTSKFTGLEIELFREVTTRMGISEDQIDWKCLAWGDLMAGLYNNTCDIAPAGMIAAPDRLEKGLRFSAPSMRSGLRVMVSVEESTPGWWYFLSGMDWEVWVLLLVSGILIGFVVWFMEIGMRALTSDTRVLGNVMWDTVGRPVQMRDYRLHSVPANVTAYVWSFLAFIVMVLYGANLTSNLTVNQIKNDIHSVKDLPGKAVVTWTGFVDTLKDYNVAGTGYPWDSSTDVNTMIDALTSGLFRALVMDGNVLSVYDSTNCDTMLVGNIFHQEDVCVGFPPHLWKENQEFVDAFNLVMYDVTQGTGGIEALQARFIDVPQATCKSQVVSNGYASVYLEEVAGLWIILASSVLFGVLYIAVYRCHYHRKMKRATMRTKSKLMRQNSSWRKHLSNLVNEGMMKRNDLFEADLMDHNERYDGASMGYIDGTADVQATYEYRDRVRNSRAANGSALQTVLAELADIRSELAKVNGGSPGTSSDQSSEPASASASEQPMQQQYSEQPQFSEPIPTSIIDRAEVMPAVVVPPRTVNRLISYKLPMSEDDLV